MTSRKVWLYNLDNNRDPAQVKKEIQAILETGPALFGMCEATGYDLPDYGKWQKVRDRSNKSRANIAAYVDKSLFGGSVAWVDLRQTWSRTNPGATGQHEPRSYVRFLLGQMQILVAHQPPKQCDNHPAAQQEGIDAYARDMKPKADANEHQKQRPRLIVADFNRRKDEPGPGPLPLADLIGGKVAGQKIDAAVFRKADVTDLAYPEKVGGVKLKSDHGHALRFTLTAENDWWTPE